MNLGIENASITGTDGSVNLGGLAGMTSGLLSNCYVTGKITAGKKVRSLGGLVGSKQVGVITDCFAAVSISAGDGADQIGGLVAYSYMGTISRCYAIGRISAGEKSKYVGGLVGWRSAAGDVSRCFWDTESTRLSESNGGDGLPTTRMHDVQTFLTTGWDFLGQRSNGSAGIANARQGVIPSWRSSGRAFNRTGCRAPGTSEDRTR